MLHTLYLIGYGNQVPERLFERLESGLPSGNSNRCLIIDIRARRRSWAWSYTGPRTEMLFKKRGHDYIWMHELGNAGNIREVKLLNEPHGMMALEFKVRTSRVPVVLLCAELRSKDCHRSVVAEKLADRLKARGDELEIRPL